MNFMLEKNKAPHMMSMLHNLMKGHVLGVGTYLSLQSPRKHQDTAQPQRHQAELWLLAPWAPDS